MIATGILLQNRYRIIKQIGQGGMGAVYVATDERFHSTVALKETLFNEPSLRKAFEREAHLLNRLRHSALPKVSDHFVEGAGQFLVMEFIAGDDLSEMLQQRAGAFPLSDVLAWADQLLDAIDYLHTQEPPIIHRDIKPQNLKLTPRGHIVLLDFGLAKGMPVQARATATGSVFGFSRNYAPLEQIQGAGTDVRSDLYSLGATLYHLLTGLTPPDALTRATAVINNQADPLRPAHEVHPQVPPPISELLHRAMAQNAALRPQTAADMRASLQQATQQQGTNTSDVTSRQQAVTVTNISEEQTKLFNSQAATRNSQSSNLPVKSDAATEATIVKQAPYSSISATNTAPLHAAPNEVRETVTMRSSTKRIGIALAAAITLLVAVAGAYTLARRNAPEATTTDAQNKTQSETPIVAQTPVQTDAANVAPSPATVETAMEPQTNPATNGNARRANATTRSKVTQRSEARKTDGERAAAPDLKTAQESDEQINDETIPAPAATPQREQPLPNEANLPANTRPNFDEEMRRAAEFRRRLWRMRQPPPPQRPPAERRRQRPAEKN